MSKFKSIKHSVQINDLLFEFFPTRKVQLSVSFFEENGDHFSNSHTFHTHSHTEIFACKRGIIYIKTPQAVYTLEAGDIAVIPLGVVHTKLKSSDLEAEWNSVGLMCTECKTESESGLFSTVSSFIYSDEISVIRNKHCVFELLSEVIDVPQSTVPHLSGIGLAAEICRLASMSKVTCGTTASKQKLKRTDIDRLLKIDATVNGKYMLNISNKWLADELFLSERQLSRLVNRHYGMPLHSLIINRRIEVAATLLLDTDDTVEQIIAAVGFNSKTGFYREFERIYGQTPLKFRKAHKSAPK